MSEELKKFYFTFGDDRLNKYVRIHAKNEDIALKRMFFECGRRWCGLYHEEDFKRMLEDRKNQGFSPDMELLFTFWCNEDD